MGLRFRKSVTICKGVKLNFGKTGASVTFGSKGYHKTISTSGRVTTSLGIPGTGVYYTDTKRIGGNRNNSTNRGRTNNSRIRQNADNSLERNYERTIPGSNETLYNDSSIHEGNSDFTGSHDIADGQAQSSIIEEPIYTYDLMSKPVRDWNEARYRENQTVEFNAEYDESEFTDSLVKVRKPDCTNDSSSNSAGNIYITKENLKMIYAYCDPDIPWNQIAEGNSAGELHMYPEIWDYCAKISSKIIDGDINTYLEAIAELAPVEDLLLYAENFEFGTDSPDFIEVEFAITPDGNLLHGKDDDLFEEFVQAVAVRVARDLGALLPVEKIIVHAIYNDQEKLNKVFMKKNLYMINYEMLSIKQVLECV